MRFAMYWASPFVPAIATLIILPIEGDERGSKHRPIYVMLCQDTNTPPLDPFVEPAMSGAVMANSGCRLPGESQAAHICWGRDSVHFMSKATKDNEFLISTAERI